jgi:heptosyltransferase-1
VAVVALVHGTSRADKLWPENEWIDLARRLMQTGLGIALLHGNDEELARSERIAQAVLAAALPDAPPVQVWPRLSLDALTDALAQTAGVIGVDSGLSHIAVALDLPHVQLYNFDTAWRTGPSNTGLRQRSVFAAPHPAQDQVWQAWQTVSASRPGREAAAP